MTRTERRRKKKMVVMMVGEAGRGWVDSRLFLVLVLVAAVVVTTWFWRALHWEGMAG